MKLYKKEDLVLKNGYLVTAGGNEVIVVDPAAVCQANRLETLYQKAAYLAEQPEATPIPSLDGFERESSHDVPKFVCETPLNDAEVEHSIALMDEIDRAQVTQHMNEMLESMTELVEFVKSDEVVELEGLAPSQFDTPRLGDPLEWDLDFLMSRVAFTFPGVSVDEPPAVESE